MKNDTRMAMTCPDARDALLLEEAGELAAAASARLHLHLRTCAACAAVGVANRALLQDLTASMKPSYPSEAARQSVRQAVWTMAGRRRRARLARRWVAAVAACLLALAAGVRLLQPSSHAPRPDDAMAGLITWAVEGDADNTGNPMEDLALQLMELQGLTEETSDLDFMEGADEEHPAIDLQSHSAVGPRQSECV